MLSVIVPVIDEAGALPGLLADIAAQRGLALEVVMVDGGSRDASPDIARAAGARVIESRPGRGAQMNAGAAAALGDWLCFLHADSRLTHPAQLADALARLEACDDQRVAGHFRLRFVRARAGRGLFYRYLEAKTATGRRHTINGDQGLMLRRAFFDALGGFDTRLPFLEDQRMAAAIRARGRWCLLEHPLATSARRFEVEGAFARYLLMALIMSMHLADVSLFFARAPRVYARQPETGRLRLMPYFRLLRTLARDCGPRATGRVAWRVAGVAVSQSWQLFFALDVGLEQGLGVSRRPATRLHDRLLRPVFHNRVARGLVLVLGAGVVFGPLQLGCALVERARRDEARPE